MYQNKDLSQNLINTASPKVDPFDDAGLKFDQQSGLTQRHTSGKRSRRSSFGELPEDYNIHSNKYMQLKNIIQKSKLREEDGSTTPYPDFKEKDKKKEYKVQELKDAKNCIEISDIHTIKKNAKHLVNPKQAYFDESHDYFTKRFAQRKPTEIGITSYIITEDHESFVKDLSVDIVHTTQGAIPVVKTFEVNAYNDRKWVKALKFYNTDGTLKKQFVVNEGFLSKNYNTYDTSILAIGNYIVFYVREDQEHILRLYDLVRDLETELRGYTITERSLHYHIMFSHEIQAESLKTFTSQTFLAGVGGEDDKISDSDLLNIQNFLDNQFIVIQPYAVREDQSRDVSRMTESVGAGIPWKDMSVKPIIVYRLCNVDRSYTEGPQNIDTSRMSERSPLSPQSSFAGPGIGLDEDALHSCQYCCHIIQENVIQFIAIDTANTKMFQLEMAPNARQLPKGSDRFKGQVEMYEHVTEERMTYYTGEGLNVDDKEPRPFLKHENEQIIVQADKVDAPVVHSELKADQEGKEWQYYYMTNEHQYVLIYPNYEKPEEKSQVIFQLSQKNNGYNFDDIENEYKAEHDFRKRRNEYELTKTKRVQNISVNHPSRSHIKNADHIQKILKMKRKLDENDRIILTSDEREARIYVYQKAKVTINVDGEERLVDFAGEDYKKWKHSSQLKAQQRIQYFIYTNNTDYAKEVGTLACAYQKLVQIDGRAQQEVGTYRLNGTYKQILASPIAVHTENEDDISKGQKFYFKTDQEKKNILLENERDGQYSHIKYSVDEGTDSLQLMTHTRFEGKNLYCFKFEKKLQHIKIKKVYFLVCTGSTEVDLSDNILHSQTQVHVFSRNRKDPEIMKFEKLQNILIESSNLSGKERTVKDEDYLNINLTFEVINDSSQPQYFMPIIYQADHQEQLILFNTEDAKILNSVAVSAASSFREGLAKFNNYPFYRLCRTSDFFTQKGFNFHETKVVKYSVTREVKFAEDQGLFLDVCEFQIKKEEESLKISLLGKKYVMFSSAYFNKKEKFHVLPSYDKLGQITGSEIVLSSNLCIKMSDQHLNTLYVMETQLLQCGYQKFMVSHMNQKDYVLVVSAQLKQKVALANTFDHPESYWILTKTMRNVLMMQPASFEYHVLYDDFNELLQEKFFLKQEMLQGRTICDLCVCFPKEVFIGLHKEQDVYGRGMLIDELTDFSPANLENYNQLGLISQTLYVQSDFNLVTTLRLAMELSQNQVVKLLLDKLFEINNGQDEQEQQSIYVQQNLSKLEYNMQNQPVENYFRRDYYGVYRDVFMLDLPIFLQQKLLKRLFPFFGRTNITMQNMEAAYEDRFNPRQKSYDICSFEKFMINEDLPPFLSKSKQYITIPEFNDFHNAESEITQSIIKQDPYMTYDVEGFSEGFDQDEDGEIIRKREYEIEHSIIDFRLLIIGQKFREFQNNSSNIRFDGQHLATLLSLDQHDQEDVLEFYELEAVKKLIDYQFETTRAFMTKIFFFYSFGFVIPALLAFNIDYPSLQNLLFTIAMFTQLILFLVDVLNIHKLGCKLFWNDYRNWLDTIQFIVWSFVFVIKLLNQFSSDSPLEILMQVILFIFSFQRLAYLSTVYDSNLYFNIMFKRMLADISPFMFLLGLGLGLFTMLYEFLHLSTEDGYFMPTILGVLGKIQTPKVDMKVQVRYAENNFVKSMLKNSLELSWLIQIIVFGLAIIFMIAQAVMSHERNASRMVMLSYRAKAAMNRNTFSIIDFLVAMKPFKVLVFSLERNATRKPKTCVTWPGTYKMVDQSLQDNVKILYNLMKANNEKFEDLNDRNVTTHNVLANIVKQMPDVNQNLKKSASFGPNAGSFTSKRMSFQN